MYSRAIVLSKNLRTKSGKLLCQHFCSDINKAPRLSKPYEHAHLNQTMARIPSCGQPTPLTHPFLLSEGEILPGLKSEEFKRRRQRLMELIFADSFRTYGKPVHHIVVVPSATKLYMTEKIPYVFHQNTDFLYLTGCLEPDTALLLTGSCNEDMISTLFLQIPNPQAEIWDGPQTGRDAALELFEVNEALTMLDLPDFLTRNAEKHPHHVLYFDSLNTKSFTLHSLIEKHVQKFNIMLGRSCKNFIDHLRLIKSPAEQNLMRKAGEISSIAIEEAIKATHPGITEHQLFATVDYASRMRGAEILAYPPVVASGKNANIIHYISNNQKTRDGDLILMDAGCEYHGYCGDITRTWPVNGKFSGYQLILYEIVLEVQKELIQTCNTSFSLNSLYERMITLLSQYLRSEKILKHNFFDLNGIKQISKCLCPHHVGHYLGMDVHDVKTAPKDKTLTPGMIITIEPGLYTNENPDIAPEFWNLGIRVEDNILITDIGYEVLSNRCPKEVKDIEEIMKK